MGLTTILARKAVDRMGDVFYDADDYPDETVACPECGEDVFVRSTSCPHCNTAFEEPLSKTQAILEYAVVCVEEAIREALACHQGRPLRLVVRDGDEMPYSSLAVYLNNGDEEWLVSIRVFPRRYPHSRSRATRKDKAVWLTFRLVNGFAHEEVSLDQATAWLQGLGLDPAPLLAQAREKSWEV